MRASDSDRQAVVDQLRTAVDEGRLGLLEWNERVARAYQSRTYAELAEVAADLPASQPAHRPEPAVSAAPRLSDGSSGIIRDLPTPLKVLWTVWLSVVLINVVIWAMVSAAGDLKYFWPAWVAGPTGAGLLGVSVGVTMIRRSRRTAAAQRRASAPRSRR
ncbi:MAG: DUF1707 domain-containing protein [Jatrophihabitantaceae bacterium]